LKEKETLFEGAGSPQGKRGLPTPRRGGNLSSRRKKKKNTLVLGKKLSEHWEGDLADKPLFRSISREMEKGSSRLANRTRRFIREEKEGGTHLKKLGSGQLRYGEGGGAFVVPKKKGTLLRSKEGNCSLTTTRG